MWTFQSPSVISPFRKVFDIKLFVAISLKAKVGSKGLGLADVLFGFIS